MLSVGVRSEGVLNGRGVNVKPFDFKCDDAGVRGEGVRHARVSIVDGMRNM